MPCHHVPSKERTGPRPQRGPIVPGPSTGPPSPSFPIGHASSILITRSTAAFLLVALSGLAASSARMIFDFRASNGLLLPGLRLIWASKAAVGEEVVAFTDDEFARSTFTGQRRTLSSRCGPVRPIRRFAVTSSIRRTQQLPRRPRLLRPTALPRRHPLPSPPNPRQPARRHPPRLPPKPHPLRRTPRVAQGTRQTQPSSLTASGRRMSSQVTFSTRVIRTTSPGGPVGAPVPG